MGDRAPRAQLLDDVMVGLSKEIPPVLAGFSVGLVDVRFAAENLLRLSVRVGERLPKLPVARRLATVNFSIQDLLRVDFCVLVPFRPPRVCRLQGLVLCAP